MTNFPGMPTPVDAPFLKRQPLVYLKNAESSLEMPPFGVGKITGMTSHGGYQVWTVEQPDGSSQKVYAVNGPLAIPAGKVGAGHVGPIVQAAYDTGDGTPSGEWGPQSGSWLLKSAGTGFNIVGVRDLADTDIVDAVQAAGSTGNIPVDMVVATLSQDIVGDGTETNVTVGASKTWLGPKGSDGVVSVDQVTNARLDIIGKSGTEVLLAYDSVASTSNANDTWFILANEHLSDTPTIFGVMNGGTHTATQGTATKTIELDNSVRVGNMIVTNDTANYEFDYSRVGTYAYGCHISVRADSGGTSSWAILEQVELTSNIDTLESFNPRCDLHGTSTAYVLEHLSQSGVFEAASAPGTISWLLRPVGGGTFAEDIEIETAWAWCKLVRPGW